MRILIVEDEYKLADVIAIGILLGKMGYTFIPSTGIVLIAFLSSALLGTIFRIFPANKASKLNPINALHTD